MNTMYKLGRLLLVVVTLLSSSVAMPVYASHQGDVLVKADLFADGSVGCTGADDLSDTDGYVLLQPREGGVRVKIRLRNAEPNRTYTVAVSEEPSCSSAAFFASITTNRAGNANTTVFYATSAGSHNLLVNLGTSASGLSDPRHKEIATTNAVVFVPAM